MNVQHPLNRILIGGNALLLLATAACGQEAACPRVSQLMSLSCSAESAEEYFAATAACRNNFGPGSDCWRDALDEFDEALAFCGEVKDARNDVCDALPDDGEYAPDLNPDNFLSLEDAAANPNPYFPLVPGTVWTYEGEDETIVVEVLPIDEGREILGIECFSVRDTVTEDGEFVELTIDWYAVDVAGNVWYMGEVAQNFEDGFLTDLDGSWVAGVDGAQPGILTEANPMVGPLRRTEFLIGEAEDVAMTVSVTGDEMVPAAACAGACVITNEGTPLEPDADEDKYALAGVGTILEIDKTDGSRTELVEVTFPE